MKENIILLHGALGSKEQLMELSTKLNDTFNVVVFDLEGHGKNQNKVEFDMKLFGRQIAKEMDERKIMRSHIFGFSMGGYAALQLATSDPDRVGDVICLGTKLEWSPAIAEKETSMLDKDKLQEKVPHYVDLLSKRHFDWKGLLYNTRKMMLDLGNGAALDATDFSIITSRVLLCVGEHDNMVSIDETKKTANEIPNGNLKILKNTAHPIEKLDMLMLSQIIENFICTKQHNHNSKII